MDLITDEPAPTTKPIFVPIALKDDEARAVFNACRAVFAQLTEMRQAVTHGGELARAMVTIGAAIDKATA